MQLVTYLSWLWLLSVLTIGQQCSAQVEADTVVLDVPQEGRVLAIGFDVTNTRVAAIVGGEVFGDALVWDLDAPSRPWRVGGRSLNASALCFVPNSNLIALAVLQDPVHMAIELWDYIEQKRVGRFGEYKGNIACLDATSTGLLAVSGDGGAEVHIYRVRDQRLDNRLTARGQAALTSRFSSDGKTVAATIVTDADTSLLAVWALPEGEMTKTLSNVLVGSARRYELVAFDSALETFVTLHADSAGNVTSRTSGGEIIATIDSTVPRKTMRGVTTGRISRSGKLVALGLLDGSVKVLSVGSGRQLAVYPKGSSRIDAMAFSADDGALAVGVGRREPRIVIRKMDMMNGR